MPLSEVLHAGIVVLVFLACCDHLQADVDIDRVVTTLQTNFAKIVSEELGASRLTVSENDMFCSSSIGISIVIYRREYVLL